MRIDQTVIREILSRTDIGVFIGTYVQLRKAGRDLVGLCPFHGENTPSFHVHPDRGFFKCFGCGEGGDAIAFIRKLENLTFPDAARVLARRAGIELEPESPQAARARSEKEQIYAANELAVAYFAKCLRIGPEGAPAREYVAKRGIAPAAVESFKLGYAPGGWDGLVRELAAGGVDLAVAERAGLVRAGQRGHYDFYRHRLMIPTYATTGEPVAFGGRSLDGSEPKYLNTSTTPVYTKGRGLYALSVARRAAAAKQSLIVVEGYLDCIALHESGFGNAVASLGTAFTPEQAAELRKYAERVFLAFDADAAGGAATMKSIRILQDAGCVPYVVRLPAGEDPDTYVRTHGAAAFQALLDAALDMYGSRFAVETEADRIAALRLPPQQALERLAEFIRTEVPPAETERLTQDGALRLGVPVAELRKHVRQVRPGHFAPRGFADARGGRLPGPGEAPRMVRHAAPVAEMPSFEREILAALFDEPALVAEYAARIPLATFRDERSRGVYATLLAAGPGLAAPADVLALLAEDDDAMALAIAIQTQDRSAKARFETSDARREHLDRVVERLEDGRRTARIKELDDAMAAAFDAGGEFTGPEREEYLRLIDEAEQRKKKRLGPR